MINQWYKIPCNGVFRRYRVEHTPSSLAPRSLPLRPHFPLPAYDRACAVLPAPPLRERRCEPRPNDQLRARAAERRRASPTIPTRLVGRRPDVTCPSARVLATSGDFVSALPSPLVVVCFSGVPSRRGEWERKSEHASCSWSRRRATAPLPSSRIGRSRDPGRASLRKERTRESALQLNWPLRM